MNHYIALEECLKNKMDEGDALLAQSVLGTDNPILIAQAIEQFCQNNLGYSVASCEFWYFSVSCSFGLRLENDRQVVVKVRSPDNISFDALQAACYVQNELASHGYPCPKILLFPTSLAGGFASVEEFVNVGEYADAHNPIIRKAMAKGLAGLIQQAKQFINLPSLTRSQTARDRSIFPKPHNALFDFGQTKEGAEWIDDIAKSAKAIIANPTSPIVLGHGDWSAQNMLFANENISVVYDWDSLRLESEAILVGKAAATFPFNYVLDFAIAPTPEESQLFVKEYEAARGEPFSTGELQSLFAALIYTAAYKARCEHCSALKEENYETEARRTLRIYAERLCHFF